MIYTERRVPRKNQKVNVKDKKSRGGDGRFSDDGSLGSKHAARTGPKRGETTPDIPASVVQQRRQTTLAAPIR